MLKQYTLTVFIEEGCDEFWESIKDTGCDEVVALVEDALVDYGFNDAKVKLIKFALRREVDDVE